MIFVMAGLVPAIHVLLAYGAAKTWMPGTSPGMTTFEIAPVSKDYLTSRRNDHLADRP
jgi:hypothetical protein